MKLKSYLDWKDIRQIDFAERAKISATFLSLILQGKRRPGPAAATRISDATEGQVSRLELLYPDER